MPYVSIPTLTDGSVLSASHLNLLSGNQSFLYGIANQANAPFNSYRATKVTLDSEDMLWYVRHRVNYFHWKVTSQGGAWNYARVYYNGVKVGKQGSGTSFQGAYNLATWAGLPNLRGAWASGVDYEDDRDGDGDGGNPDDGDVVSSGGQYYRCTVAHTSGAGTQPGVGGSWATVWQLLTLPALGTMCVAWADINFSSGTEVTVEYFFEMDSASL